MSARNSKENRTLIFLAHILVVYSEMFYMRTLVCSTRMEMNTIARHNEALCALDIHLNQSFTFNTNARHHSCVCVFNALDHFIWKYFSFVVLLLGAKHGPRCVGSVRSRSRIIRSRHVCVCVCANFVCVFAGCACRNIWNAPNFFWPNGFVDLCDTYAFFSRLFLWLRQNSKSAQKRVDVCV